MLRCLVLLATVQVLGGHGLNGQQLVQYREVDTVKLFLEVHKPEVMDANLEYPAMVFFFGGGWRGGDRYHFINQARYLSKRGMVCFLADYRVWNKHQVTPFECLKDAKSAVRFVRAHAAEFGVDPDRIVAAGGSAGGHLAAATALVQGFNHPLDDLSTSCVPNALVLFNPVIDNGPGGYGYDRVSESYLVFSPLHNIRPGAPPTILFLGNQDQLIPVATAEYYRTVMEKVGSRCDLKIYPDVGHGFFNYQHFDHYKETLKETDVFLQSLGYLSDKPLVSIE